MSKREERPKVSDVFPRRTSGVRLPSRGLCFTLALALTSFQCVPPAFAAEFRVFKKTYVRQSGAPVTETDPVPVLNPTGTPWMLRALNGSLEDTSIEQVSSSTLSLNGVEVLQPNQFNQTVSLRIVQLRLSTLMGSSEWFQRQPWWASLARLCPVRMWE